MSITIRDKVSFNYDGIWSDEFGLMSVTLDNSLFEEALVSERSILETEINGSDEPIFHKVVNSPLEFDLTIAFENGFDDSMIDEIIDWMFSDGYKPLFFKGKENRIYKCIAVGDSSLVHNGLKQGYFTVTFRCNSSRLYSPQITTEMVSVRSSSQIVTIYSDSSIDAYPEISIRKVGSGDVTIESLHNYGATFKIVNLNDLESIYIDSRREIIETNAVGIYRYNNTVGMFPTMRKGENRFRITGSCDIMFRYILQYRK